MPALLAQVGELLWGRVAKGDAEACWPWLGRRRGGYGYVAVHGKWEEGAHRERILAGETNVAIAKDYGVTDSMISRIRRGSSWGGPALTPEYESLRQSPYFRPGGQ